MSSAPIARNLALWCSPYLRIASLTCGPLGQSFLGYPAIIICGFVAFGSIGSKALLLGIGTAVAGGGACGICSGTVGACTVGCPFGVGVGVVPVVRSSVLFDCVVTGNAGACTVIVVLRALSASSFGHMRLGWKGT